MSAIDIPNLLLETGDVLLAQTAQDGKLSFRIEKA
jgi:hypothetical protein